MNKNQSELMEETEIEITPYQIIEDNSPVIEIQIPEWDIEDLKSNEENQELLKYKGIEICQKNTQSDDQIELDEYSDVFYDRKSEK